MKEYFLMAGALLASCAAHGQAVDGGLASPGSSGVHIGKMAPCAGTRSVDESPKDASGLIKITLPDDLTFSYIPRRASADGETITDQQSLGAEDDPAFDGNPGAYEGSQPFDVHIREPYAARYIAVRIIKKQGSPYLLYDAEQIQGIALGAVDAGAALCGAHFIEGRTGDGTRRQTVVFFVDTRQFLGPKTVPFKIGVIPEKYPETVLFIDPKVRNDGSPFR